MAVTQKSDEENDFLSQEFRDSISTVDESGKRVWIYPKKPKGRFFNRRLLVGWAILGFFFATPFITLPNGQPLLMLNVFERKFVLFGHLFVPQDFFVLALTLILIFVSVILFTVAFGRIWCGWACPQTLFMELIFRQIEYLVEGDAAKQRALNKAPWNGAKIRKRITKHALFIIISSIIGHTFLGILVGSGEVLEMLSEGPADHMGVFIGITAVSILVYLVFSQFREQVCIAVCPYGRLQGVLLDKDSVVISYDYQRGEPRGRLSKQKRDKTKEWGDCIDCHQCVDVCPTGIDIRNGTQLECVNCTACIDACDSIMDKIGKPRGLVRYASENQIKNQTKFRFTPRMIAYSGILVILLSIVTYLISTRSIVETTILKTTGQKMYEKTDDGQITNMYTIQIVSKTSDDLNLELKLVAPKGAEMNLIGNTAANIPIKGQGTFDGTFILTLPEESLKTRSQEVVLEVWSDGVLLETQTSSFIGPFR